MKNKDKCEIPPSEVNHTNYAYIIGKKHGEDAARAAKGRFDDPPTRDEVLAEFERFGSRMTETDTYRSLMEEMDGERGKGVFWDGAKDGFLEEAQPQESEEEKLVDV